MKLTDPRGLSDSELAMEISDFIYTNYDEFADKQWPELKLLVDELERRFVTGPILREDPNAKSLS